MKVEKVLITIPAYNEEKNIGNVLENINKVLDSSSYHYKILVVDDGSRDQTRQIALTHGAIVFSHQRNMGLAETFRTEMRECLKLNFDAIVHTDADSQYHASDILRLLQEIEKGYDLVLGSRFKGKIEKMSFLKRIGNKAFSKVIANITGLNISDGQTGFRAFTRDVAEKVKITSDHTYTQEQIIRASREKFRINEIPVDFAKRGNNTKSRLISNPFEYAIKAWINILKILRDYEPLKFFGAIGFFFIIFAIILGAWLLSLFIRFESIGHSNLVLFTLILISIGVQVLIFAFFADMFKK